VAADAIGAVIDARQGVLNLGEHPLLGTVHSDAPGLLKDDRGVIRHVIPQACPLFVGAQPVRVCQLLRQTLPFLLEVRTQVH